MTDLSAWRRASYRDVVLAQPFSGRSVLIGDAAHGMSPQLGQGVNMVTGDYSRGAAGFWVEGGEIAYPVHEITIAGNILDLLKHVDAVGSDLRFSGRIGSPSLRIRELSIGGK